MADSMLKLLQICEDGAWSQKREPPQRPCPKFDFDKTGSLSTSQGVLGDKARAKIVYFRTTTYKASAIDGLFVSSWSSSGDGRGNVRPLNCVSLKEFEFCAQPFPARQTSQAM